ncbi:MAG: hypothetical protein ABSB90_07555 [Thermoplasmata archaeon]|jgi:hypothetical protein
MAQHRTTTTTGNTHRLKPRYVIGGTIVALLVIGGGWVLAASFAVQQGSTETGSGVYHGTSSLTYWTESTAGVTTQSATPAVLSTTVGTPTVLPAVGTSYGINAPTLNDITHYWKFTEATTAPASTEVELQFSVSLGAVPTVTTVTVYVETQATVPATAQTFTLYYDLGSPATATITLNSVTQLGEQCSAVGTCP